MYGGRNGYLFQRMAVSENAVADMDDFVRNVDSCKAVASFECGIAEIDHGGGQRDRREGNTAGVFASLLLSIIYILNGRKVIAWIL